MHAGIKGSSAADRSVAQQHVAGAFLDGHQSGRPLSLIRGPRSTDGVSAVQQKARLLRLTGSFHTANLPLPENACLFSS
jgi:hypothetical protein